MGCDGDRFIELGYMIFSSSDDGVRRCGLFFFLKYSASRYVSRRVTFPLDVKDTGIVVAVFNDVYATPGVLPVWFFFLANTLSPTCSCSIV